MKSQLQKMSFILKFGSNKWEQLYFDINNGVYLCSMFRLRDNEMYLFYQFKMKCQDEDTKPDW